MTIIWGSKACAIWNPLKRSIRLPADWIAANTAITRNPSTRPVASSRTTPVMNPAVSLGTASADSRWDTARPRPIPSMALILAGMA